MRRGLFVTFEGLDGSGKSLQVARVAERLVADGIGVLTSREPGATPLGLTLRTAVLEGDGRPAPMTELLLYLADRAEHIARVLGPALAEADVVLCDRYADSTIAYQGGGRQVLPLDALLRLNAAVVGDYVPDLTVLLDLPAHAVVRRLGQRAPDRIEAESLAFFTRVRATYHVLLERERARFFCCDATDPAERITERIVTEIRRRLDAPRAEATT